MVSKISELSFAASGESKGRPRRMNASASPWTPMPMGLCLMLEFLAVSAG